MYTFTRCPYRGRQKGPHFVFEYGPLHSRYQPFMDQQSWRDQSTTVACCLLLFCQIGSFLQQKKRKHLHQRRSYGQVSYYTYILLCLEVIFYQYYINYMYLLLYGHLFEASSPF